MNIDKIKTLGALKATGYRPQGIKEEIRRNLIEKLKKQETTFPRIIGYEDTVIPDLERALLSKHNILFLGLRGQANKNGEANDRSSGRIYSHRCRE